MNMFSTKKLKGYYLHEACVHYDFFLMKNKRWYKHLTSFDHGLLLTFPIVVLTLYAKC